MILVTKCDIFNQGVEAIVNPVNCMGVMGAGLAKQFKIRYPEYYESYRDLCLEFKLSLSHVSLYKRHEHENPKYIISFPTKYSWKDNSDIYAIDRGMDSLLECCVEMNIQSIAIPALGCGLGGLNWKLDILPLLKFKLEPYPDLHTILIPPK